MAAWREEDHPRDAGGRFTVKGMAAAASIKRTMANPQSASDDDLLDVFARISSRKRLGKRDQLALIALDAELARRESDGEPELTPEQRRVDELVASGETWEQAYRDVYGRSGGGRVDDPDRRAGESAEQSRRRQYAELTYLTMLQAEDWTRGNLVTREAQAKGISAASLFSGPRARADKWASEELRRYWAEVQPRRTYAEYRAERVGDTGGARKARARRVQAGNGKDFG